MTIEVNEKELHEIICGLHINAARLRSRINRGKRQIDNFQPGGTKLEDTAKLAYLSSLVTLREARVNYINELAARIEPLEKQNGNEN